MSYNDCRHGAEMCDQCLEIMSDGIRQGTEEERERIIALLQTEIFVDENDENATIFDVYLNKLIALIKGENK